MSFTADGVYNSNEMEIADDMRTFLKRFLELYPKTKEMDWVFAGQSYGGRYLPNIYFNLQINPLEMNIVKWILVDPFVYPLIQKTSARNEIYSGLGLLDPVQTAQYNTLQQRCGEAIVSNSKNMTLVCKAPERFVGNQTGGIEISDVRSIKKGFDFMGVYFNDTRFRDDILIFSF